MAEEAEEAERKALFLLNSVDEDVKIKALDMLRAISGGQKPVLPEREDGDQVYYNRRGQVEIETVLYRGRSMSQAARKKAYGPQVIPMLPPELEWYGHKKGMPEPQRGNPIAQRRAHGPSTLGSDEDDGEDEQDFNFDVPMIRRRRRSTSTPPDSAVHSPTQSAPGPPKVMYAKKTGAPHMRPSRLNAQRRAHGPSTLRSDDDDDGDYEPDFSTDDDDKEEELDFNFNVPRTRRRRRSTSTPPDSAVRSPTQSEPGSPKTKYAKNTDTSDTRMFRPRQAQTWDPQEIDEQIRRDMARRREKERAEGEVGFLVPNTGSGNQRSTEAPKTFEIDDNEMSSNRYAEAERNRATAQGERKPRTKTILRKNVSSGVTGISASRRSAATKASSSRTAAAPVDRESTQRSNTHTPAAQTSRALSSGVTGISASRRSAATEASSSRTAAAPVDRESTQRLNPHTPAAQTSQALSSGVTGISASKRSAATEASSSRALSSGVTGISASKRPAATKASSSRTAAAPVDRESTQRSNTHTPAAQTSRALSSGLTEISASRSSAATEASLFRTAAAPVDRESTQRSNPHTPAAQTSRALRSARGAPIKAEKDQTTMKAAKESEVPPRRRNVPPVAKKPKALKEESDEEMIFLPGLRDLIAFTDDEEDDDDDERIYGHGDARLRTTAARSSRPKRLNAMLSSPSQPSPSKSPRKSRAKKPSDAAIRASLRPANQPPPKLQFTPGEVKKLGLEGVAKFEKDKVDRSFDKNAPGYSEHNKYSRYINRTDDARPSPKKIARPEHMMSGDFYYPEEVPKEQSTPPPPPPPAQQRPQQQQPQQQRPQQQHTTTPQAPRRQQQQQEPQRRSMAQAPPRRPQQQRRGTSVVHQPRRGQAQVRDDEYRVASDEAPPQASAGPRNPTSRRTPGWASSEWMDMARELGRDDQLKKFVKKKD